MFRGAGRGRRGRGGAGQSVTRLNGLFQDGQWLCNCAPRLPAKHFQVKKESVNKGRWFYTCQRPRESSERCDFYLWDEDAKLREGSAAPPAELQRQAEASSNAGTRAPAGLRRSSPPPPYDQGVFNDSMIGNQLSDIEVEDILWPPTGQVEAAIRRRADATTPPPVTPRKPETTATFEAGSTGKRKLSEVDDVHYPALPTPSTTGRTTAGRFEDRTPSSGPLGYGSPQTTPTPSRFRDALSSPEGSFDLTSDVMNLLQSRNVRLSDDVRAALRELLSQRSLRMQGIAKGRDVIRLQIKAKDARIAEQQHRIATLEAELEAERALVQHLRWERQNGQEGE